MTGDCHVRFCESGGAQSSLPLTKNHGHHTEGSPGRPNQPPELE